MSDDILDLLTQKETALVGELEKVRAAKAALGAFGNATVAPARGRASKAPKVQMTTSANDEDSGSLPAPKRSMSKAARKKLSLNMKARWAKVKAAKAQA